MKERLNDIMNNIIEWLIMMGEYCQKPRYMENYLRTVPEIPENQVSNSLIGSLEKKIVEVTKSKVAALEESPALPNRVADNEVLVSK